MDWVVLTCVVYCSSIIHPVLFEYFEGYNFVEPKVVQACEQDCVEVIPADSLC